MVIEARFPARGPARTLREIGDELGVSAEAVRQTEQRALAKLRSAISR
jgi:DNA-directed RNA polymerase sigma subunit (sigma70/sigma32)